MEKFMVFKNLKKLDLSHNQILEIPNNVLIFYKDWLNVKIINLKYLK